MLFDSKPRYRPQTAFSPLFLGLTLFWCCATQAVSAEAPRWYDVEVIIFSHNSQQYRESERWPVDYDLPQTGATQELLPASGRKETPFARLDANSLRLTTQANRIKAAADMDLLLHLGWRQPGLAENKAVAVRVDDGMQGQNNPGLPRMEGTLKLVLSRYLHINTDLIYREPLSDTAASAGMPGREGAESGLFSLSGDQPSKPQYQVYHLLQSRRMRSSELHYLDHPRFGMAILVTPYEPK